MATPERFVIESLFPVINKSQEEVDFKLNSAQTAIDETGVRRIIIPKARQRGVTTYFLAKSLARCLGVDNTKAVVISHDAPATKRMLALVKFFIEHMKGPKPVIRTNSMDELTFPKRNSAFYIGTAGARAFGRGDHITDLHCSEVAYWPNPKQLMTGLLQAVSKKTGRISIESTGNGAGNWYHSQCIRAAKGTGTFKLLFLPWWSEPEYQLDLPAEECQDILAHLKAEYDEPRIYSTYKLSANQIAWRRMVIEDELDGDLFEWNKEYPSCLDDCFQAAGGGIFRKVNFVETIDWQQRDANLWILNGHPNLSLHYIIGGDVAAGVGRDASVAEIFCLETSEQVGEYINNKTEPDTFAITLSELGYKFNEAYIGCENNNHGILTMRVLTEYDHTRSTFRYPMSKIYRTPSARSKGGKEQSRRLAGLGVHTDPRSKPLMIGLLRKDLSTTTVIHSVILKNELSTFIEHEDGTVGAADGCYDDTVMAAGMVSYVKAKAALSLIDAPITPEEIKDTFSLNSIIDELTVGRNNSTFPSYLTEDL